MNVGENVGVEDVGTNVGTDDDIWSPILTVASIDELVGTEPLSANCDADDMSEASKGEEVGSPSGIVFPDSSSGIVGIVAVKICSASDKLLKGGSLPGLSWAGWSSSTQFLTSLMAYAQALPDLSPLSELYLLPTNRAWESQVQVQRN